MPTDPPPTIRVVLVDDHAMVREALAQLLEESGAVTVAGQAAARHEAVRVVTELAPDVLVLDYNIPEGGALPVIEHVVKSASNTRILVLTVHESSHYAVRVLEAGAHGFLPKSAAARELVDAIRAVHEGRIHVPDDLAPQVMHHLRRPRRERVGLESLSPRELELLRLLGSGDGLKEAADYLGISTSTASTYRTRILEKLELGGTAALIRFALEHGLVRS